MTPSNLRGRRIVLGVSGGVAAYKAAELCRELVRRGAIVSPVLTASAERFIGAATFSALASEPARTSLWDGPEASPHTDLGQAADLVLVAPATASLLAAARTGAAHDLLTTTLLATRAPVLVCPAMHTEMWEHAATRENVEVLRERGVHFVLPGDGDLAGGDQGVGRLAEPLSIADACEQVLVAGHVLEAPGDDRRTGSLSGIHVLVSAGGTREPLDPVRFLGNRSSGKQGHAVAAAAASRGARVTIVTTADLEVPQGARTIRVETAAQMRDAMVAEGPGADVIVMSAAVADYRPTTCAQLKLKRSAGVPEVTLEPTPDILSELVAGRRAGQVLVGFAAETNDVDRNARQKLQGTGVDLLVANDVSAPGTGFEHDTNAVTIHHVSGAPATVISLRSKRDVAEGVLDEVVKHVLESATAEPAPGTPPTAIPAPPRLREVR